MTININTIFFIQIIIFLKSLLHVLFLQHKTRKKINQLSFFNVITVSQFFFSFQFKEFFIFISGWLTYPFLLKQWFFLYFLKEDYRFFV